MISLNYNQITAYYSHNAITTSDSLGPHVHQNYEMFCILSGSSQYFVEGTTYTLTQGDIFIIKKGETHHELGELPRPPMRRITIQFNDEDILDTPDHRILSFLQNRPWGKYNRFPYNLFKDMPWSHYLRQLPDIKDLHVSRLYLSAVLLEMSRNYPKLTKSKTSQERPSEILNYINDHLFTDLTVQDLCKHFHVSHPFINRHIHELTGMSVGKYILNKRMLNAQTFLQNGHSPTRTCSEVGFNDYSSFYRAYCNMFGHAPSADYIKMEPKQPFWEPYSLP